MRSGKMASNLSCTSVLLVVVLFLNQTCCRVIAESFQSMYVLIITINAGDFIKI